MQVSLLLSRMGGQWRAARRVSSGMQQKGSGRKRKEGEAIFAGRTE
jgi:hypothetical protein